MESVNRESVYSLFFKENVQIKNQEIIETHGNLMSIKTCVASVGK